MMPATRAFRFPSNSKPTVLLSTEEKEDDRNSLSIDSEGQDEPERLSRRQLVLLTCGTGGLQLVWSTIMSNGTPLLITLGLPGPLTALVWVAAPLAGVLVQPYVGILSDQCQHAWGRRKPFILAGAIGTVVSMLALASTRSTVNFAISVFGGDIHSDAATLSRILFAIVWLYMLNIFIQPLQGGTRALIVDKCPTSQQAQASAYASIMTGLGNIFGYVVAFVSPKGIASLESVSQFTWLCAMASVGVMTSVALTCGFVKEEDPRDIPAVPTTDRSLVAVLKHTIWSIKTMPAATRRVCVVQFFAWMGWFPYLFYISSYVGDLYASPRLQTKESNGRQAEIIEDAVRIGSFAGLCCAITAFVANVLLPNLIETGFKGSRSDGTPLGYSRVGTAWSMSLFLFSGLMLSTILVPSVTPAIFLVAAVGVPWAFTLWVPYAIIGEEIARRRAQNSDVLQGELQPVHQDQAGAIIGLHNCAISAPQILGALVCSLVFWLAGRLGSSDGVGWVLRTGAIASLTAGFLARRAFK